MRKSYKNRTGIGIIAFVVLILFGIVTYNGIGLAEEKKDKEINIEDLRVQLENEEERSVEINNQKAIVGTKKYIEEIAREKLGLVLPDDVIIKPENEN